MTLQNGEFEDSRVNPLEPGVSGAAARVPDGGSFEKGPENGAAGSSAPPRSRRGSVRRLHTNELERLHGKSKGQNRGVEEELRRRGHNSKMLREAEWDHDQRQWRKIAKQASEVSRRRKKRMKSARLKRKRERRRERGRERLRQNRADLLARLKQGVVIVGENYDPSAADGSCPF